MVRFHLHHFKAWTISFTPLCPCLSEETLKAVGPNSCVSSRLGCLEYNFLRLETYRVQKNKEIKKIHIDVLLSITISNKVHRVLDLTRFNKTRFNKIAISNNKFQMASGQGSHWLIESPTIFSSMCSPPLSDICQFYF